VSHSKPWYFAADERSKEPNGSSSPWKARSMRYLCLMFPDVEGWDGPMDGVETSEEFSAGAAAGTRWVGSAAAAVTLRVRGGELTVLEGSASGSEGAAPAYLLLEAKDLNDAIRLASRLSMARFGRVELRPILE
jgi:hypothetical protein